MECSVCYGESGPFQKLSCGHDFCSGCIKNWYLSGTGSGCPMCRRPIYFKGFHKVRDSWNEESQNIKCVEVLNNTFDILINDAIEITNMFPKKYRKDILNNVFEDLKDTEKMYRFLRYDGFDADDIDYILNETSIYFSDRKINKNKWIDDPIIKECETQYPKLKRAKGSRCREGQGSIEWDMIVTFWTV